MGPYQSELQICISSGRWHMSMAIISASEVKHRNIVGFAFDALFMIHHEYDARAQH